MSIQTQGTSKAALTAEDQVARIFEWRRGFNAMHLIDIGVRLGLFRALLAVDKSTSGELADSLELHKPYVETWCMTAYSFGLLESDEDNAFRLAPFVDEILGNSRHPRYLGGYVRLGTEFATEDHRYCLEAFRNGSKVPFHGRGEDFAEVIAEATAGLQFLTARKLLPELPGLEAKLRAGGTLLEVGCGTGRQIVQFTKAFPEARIVGVDIDPAGLQVARRAVDKAGVADRVELLEGEVGSVTSEGSMDAVVMVEVLHEIAPDIRQQVVTDCYRALRAAGWLLIVDETYPSTLAESRQREFLFPVQTGFEELIWGNVLPTRPEQERLIRQAGFSGEIGRSIIGEGFTVLSVQK